VTQSVYAHFIGIGGAGMSAIARVLAETGTAVSGSDLKRSRYTSGLETLGVEITIGHSAQGLGDPQIVVVSTAIPESNPELAEARRRGLEVWPRARMLAHLAGERRTLAVAGTHGKTTTSAMAAWTLLGLDLDPTFLVGGELKGLDTNAHGGTGEYYVVEADESDGSFTFMEPFVAIVTNVEADHLDFYDGIAAVEAKFEEFLAKIDEHGAAVVCADDSRLLELSAACRAKVITYGLDEAADVRCEGLEPCAMGHRFEVVFPGGQRVAASLGVPGVHTVVNATGVSAAAWVLGLDAAAAAAALGSFAGVRRRFDLIGEADGVTVVDDYAHHPTEVAATLTAARDLGLWRRTWVVFQPHRYSRTAALAEDFGHAFSSADRVVLMDVYSAGEVPVPGVTGKTVLDAILDCRPRTRAAYFPHRADVERFVTSEARPGDLVLTMGAGDVTAIGGDLVRALNARRPLTETPTADLAPSCG
jgi:UDP-N-acetylmuramate--alanine ligase